MPRTDEGKLLEAIAVTAELTGTELSAAAAKIMASDLGEYPLEQVLGALRKCRQEVKSRLTIADVVTRLDDGRPGVEEAWAMIPRDEQGSVVWTEEMAQAFGVCYEMIDDDPIAARMAFKEAYLRNVSAARSEAIPVKWTPSLGRDASLRAVAIETALAKGRISAAHAVKLLPDLRVSPAIAAMVAPLAKSLTVQ